MYDLIRETAFGRLTHSISRGRFFAPPEVHNPAILDRYRAGKAASETSSLDDSSSQQDIEKEKSETPKTDAESGKDYLLVDWLENDPENPRNWPTAKKFFITFEICLLTTSVYIGSAIYTAGVPGVQEQFGVSEVAALLGLTLFVLGYATGPMLWAPMSEVPYFGRMPIYIGTLFGFVFLNFAVVYAKNFGMLLAFRFITGFVGSPCLATGGATIADMYAPKKQVYGIALWGLAATCGPVLGPLVGGFAATARGWTWTIWELIWLSGFCLVLLFFLFPETSAANILYRRTVRYRNATGNTKLKSQPEIMAEGMAPKDALKMIFVRPFTMSVSEPIVFFLNIYIALIYGLLYLWFESFPLVFIGIYHFDANTNGLAFIGLLIGAFIIVGPFFWWAYKYMEPKFDENGRIAPENRLPPAFVGAFFIPICLFWFGWSARPSISWIMPIIGSAWFTMGAFLMFMSVLAYLGDAYPDHVASVYASNDLTRSSFGAAFPLFGRAMFVNLGIGWASSLLGFLAILFIPIPFLLFKYGRQLRMRSKMANHDL